MYEYIIEEQKVNKGLCLKLSATCEYLIYKNDVFCHAKVANPFSLKYEQ